MDNKRFPWEVVRVRKSTVPLLGCYSQAEEDLVQTQEVPR